MSLLLEALRNYGLKLVSSPQHQLDQLASLVAIRSGRDKSIIKTVLEGLDEAIHHFTQQGQTVELPGIGTFTPGTDEDGLFIIDIHPDPSLLDAIRLLEMCQDETIESLDSADCEAQELWTMMVSDDALKM